MNIQSVHHNALTHAVK